ncbi:MAG: NAD(P)-dependent oxidoreductase [Devosia sp.]
MRVLITGATGKVGQWFLGRFLEDPRWVDATIVALCHNRTLPETERVKVVRGSISDPNVAGRAVEGVSHVFHMATVKEDPANAMQVSVGGMFNLLEAFRLSPTAQQSVLIGGDCVVGHCIVGHPIPVTEDSPRLSYPGVYALSKVLEEVMLEQYGIQYGLNWTVLPAPWIMEKDDFRYALSFGPEQFGGPDWDGLIDSGRRAHYTETGRVPVITTAAGLPLKRNFVHVSDLVEAMLAAIDHPAARQQLFNIAMTEPVDYGIVGEHLSRTRGMTPVEIPSGMHSNILDNAKARLLLGWAPKVDPLSLVDMAFDYVRSSDDPRKVWYVG